MHGGKHLLQPNSMLAYNLVHVHMFFGKNLLTTFCNLCVMFYFLLWAFFGDYKIFKK